MSENRYDVQGHYVPALRQAQGPPAVGPERLLPLIDDRALPTNGSEDAAALRSLATATETATPVTRAVGSSIRLAGLLVGAGVVCLALWVVGAPAALSAIGFACLLVAGWIWIVRLDHKHSPAGVERRKVASYEAIRLAEIEAQKQMGIAKLNVYERVLEKIYGRHE